MDLILAEKINEECNNFIMYTKGLTSIMSERIAHYSLEELLEARQFLVEENFKNKINGEHKSYIVCSTEEIENMHRQTRYVE